MNNVLVQHDGLCISQGAGAVQLPAYLPTIILGRRSTSLPVKAKQILEDALEALNRHILDS